MAKNIEAQGVRVGYIIGGILAVLLSALLIIMYFPDFFTAVSGLGQIWDLRTPIADFVGSNVMEYFTTWGPAGIMVLFFLIYFVCLAARQSKSATMFRLTGMFGALGCSLPFVAQALIAMDLVDLTSYVGYAMLGNFVLALVFYILGLVLRSKQKYHKNKASTTLVFCVTFWLLFCTLQSIYYVGDAFGVEALTSTFQTVIDFINAQIFSILAIYLLISAIWLFLTIPHHVRVEYNADTPDLSKPTMSTEEEMEAMTLTPEEEASAKQRSTEAIKDSGAPVTQPLSAYPDQNKANLPNPYRRKPIQPIPATPQMTQPRNLNQQAVTQNITPIRQVGTQNNVEQPSNTQQGNMITPNSPYNATTPNAMPKPYQQSSYKQTYQSPIQNQPSTPQQTQGYTPQAQPYKMPQPARPVTQNQNMTPNNWNQRRPFGQAPLPYNQQPQNQPYNPQGQSGRPTYPQQPNVPNNPNNYIPNNIRPTNPNNPNGTNGTNNGY